MHAGITRDFGRQLQESVEAKLAAERGTSQPARLYPVPVPISGGGVEVTLYAGYSGAAPIPAYGIFTSDYPWMIPLSDARVFGASDPYYDVSPTYQARVAGEADYDHLWVNSDRDMNPPDSGSFSQPCYDAIAHPVWAIYDHATDTSGYDGPVAGEIWGPIPGTFKLGKGLPGFRIAGRGYIDYEDDGVTEIRRRCLVLRDWSTPVWGVAKADWALSVYANRTFRGSVHIHPIAAQQTQDSRNVYDGTHLPYDISFTVYLSCASTRDPAIWSGDFIQYRLANPGFESGSRSPDPPVPDLCYFESARDYSDDKIGSYRLIDGSATVPHGWTELYGGTPWPFLRIGGTGAGAISYQAGATALNYQSLKLIQRTS